MSGPLDGLTVLDFSWGMSGGLASAVLADFGAEVIKVEPPSGDPFRRHPAWLSWNRGKKSVVLDLKEDAGREQAHRLAERVDVIIESFRPGVAERLGIDYQTLSELNPNLVYASISGWGQQGPLSQVAGYEGAVAARSGRMMSFAGQPNREGPVYVAVQTATWAASQAATRGILAALRERERRGRGQWVKTSLLQGMIPYEARLISRSFSLRDPQKFPAAQGLGAQPTLQYLPVRTKDGRWLQHANLMTPLFHSQLRADGLDWIFEDDRFKDAPILTDENRELLREIILERMQEKTLDEWMDIYVADGNIAAEPYQHSVQGMSHEQFVHNKHVVEIDDPRVGALKTFGVLADLRDTPGEVGGPAPELGADTRDVLARLNAPRSTEDGAVSTPGHDEGPRLLLDGITILDFATVIAGPYGAAMLADMGARVIKVDATPEREHRFMTHMAPNPLGGLKLYAGKECIQLDLKTDEGREIVHKLIEQADVLLHNFRPGVPARLGIDWETCQTINPRLIHMYIGAYGSTGPHSRRPGAHPLPGALFGGALRQAGASMPPSPDQPMSMEDVREVSRWLMRANEGNPDPNSSQAVATSIMLGLYARERTGEGQAIQATMMQANAWANADETYDFAGRPATAMPDAECFGLHALYRLYPAREGWVFLACLFDEEWQSFCAAIERTDLAMDARFATPEARQDHDSDLSEVLGALLAERSADEWEALLTAVGVACVRADVDSGEFFEEHPQSVANHLAVQTESPRVGKYTRHGGIIQFSDAPGLFEHGAFQGEHTISVMLELGYSQSEIEDLRSRRVIEWEEVNRIPAAV